MTILYLGDSPAASNYLKDVLNELEHEVTHVDFSTPPPEIDKKYEVIIVSDYPAKLLSAESTSKIRDLLKDGARLLVIGGWDSFNGLGTGYHTHPLADLLPVILQENDDRVNAWQGLVLAPDPSLKTDLAIDWHQPPVVCGYNAVEAKPEVEVLAWLKPIQTDGTTVSFLEPIPLLIAQALEKGRVVCCVTDLAPHWAGGLVDWGNQRITLPNVEVSSGYMTFVRLLLAI